MHACVYTDLLGSFLLKQKKKLPNSKSQTLKKEEDRKKGDEVCFQWGSEHGKDMFVFSVHCQRALSRSHALENLLFIELMPLAAKGKQLKEENKTINQVFQMPLYYRLIYNDCRPLWSQQKEADANRQQIAILGYFDTEKVNKQIEQGKEGEDK